MVVGGRGAAVTRGAEVSVNDCVDSADADADADVVSEAPGVVVSATTDVLSGELEGSVEGEGVDSPHAVRPAVKNKPAMRNRAAIRRAGGEAVIRERAMHRANITSCIGSRMGELKRTSEALFSTRSLLVDRTPVRGSTADGGPVENRPSAGASRAGPVATSVFDQVSEMGSASPQEDLEGRANRMRKDFHLLRRHLIGDPGRSYRALPENFVGEQIADSGDAVLLKQSSLQRSLRSSECRRQLGSRNRRDIGSESFQRIEIDAAEPPRVDHFKLRTVGEAKGKSHPFVAIVI